MHQKIEFQKSFLCPKYWGIWLVVGFLWLLNLLPYKLKYRLGALLGRAFGRIAKKRTKTARDNLKLAFPEKPETEINQILKEHFESLGISLFESMIVWWGDHRRHHEHAFEKDLISYQGLENLAEAQAQDKGIVILVPHYTTTDIIGLFLSFKVSLNPVYRPHDNPLMDYLIIKGRTLTEGQNRMFPISKHNLKGMLKVLKNKENLGFLPDQRYRAKGHIEVPFFGVNAKSNPATSKLAKLTKAVVLPTVLKRNADFTYQLTFLPPVENFPSGNDFEDTLRLHQIYEDQIRKNPAQYLWVHNRWDIKSNRGK